MHHAMFQECFVGVYSLAHRHSMLLNNELLKTGNNRERINPIIPCIYVCSRGNVSQTTQLVTQVFVAPKAIVLVTCSLFDSHETVAVISQFLFIQIILV